MKKIAIIGTGYVGLVTGTCFAELGNKVICIDNDEQKIKDLNRLRIPIYEPGLEELVRRNTKERRLSFSSKIKEGVGESDIIFIAVSTPSKDNGEADLTGIENVSQSIAKYLKSYRLVVEKSTVPVETGRWIEHTIKMNVRKNVKFDIASNPEFLREGSAISDFMHPNRVVIGVRTKRAKETLIELYKSLRCPIVVTDIESAEIIKHASNSFLATKISFINAVSQICERVGADIVKVAEGMGYDKRIERKFLDAGVGYGGSCFPKDIDAFIRLSEKNDYDFGLLKEVKRINDEQRSLIVKKIEDNLWILKGKTIGILGLSFKPGTDDMRSAPSLDIINTLQAEGAIIKAFDPQAMQKAKKILKNVKFCKDPYELAEGSSCLVLLTEWNEFKDLDFKKIKKLLEHHIIFDGRNMYNKEQLEKMGFKYIGIGRSE